MELNNYELQKLPKLLRDYLEVTFSSTVATKIPHRIFAMELLQKMGVEKGINSECYNELQECNTRNTGNLGIWKS